MSHINEVGRSASDHTPWPVRRPSGLAVAAAVAGLASGLWWVSRAGVPGNWESDLGDRLLGPAFFLGPYLVLTAAAPAD